MAGRSRRREEADFRRHVVADVSRRYLLNAHAKNKSARTHVRGYLLEKRPKAYTNGNGWNFFPRIGSLRVLSQFSKTDA